MKAGAVIVSAGLSSRMGAFKPMLPFGGETIIRHNVTTLLNAGCSPVCVVTGFRSELLKEHLAGLPVLCVENTDYRTTQMLDSVKLGLAAVKDSCECVLFTPGDACAYQNDTVSSLLDSGADICIPVFNGKRGHPVMISCRFIPRILSYEGEGGLGGALASLASPADDRTEAGSGPETCAVIKELPVNDPGILLDADTPEDYKKLTEFAEDL